VYKLFVKDRQLSDYACLVLDEVHERSVNTDILLGLTKDLLAERQDFRVVIASATMNSGIFHDFFRGAAQELRIPGRTYPIDILYAEGKDDINVSPSVYVKAALAQTEEILAETEEGDILVFVATPADTDTLATQLRARKEKRFPIHSLTRKKL
jgi:pre-mRNA-splicing factor ATP-dependent RNA helicase DHX38/PRP16